MKGPFGDRLRFEIKIIHRDFSCEEYEACLEIAHQKGWRTFTCKGCDLSKNLEEIEVYGGDDNSRKHRQTEQ